MDLKRGNFSRFHSPVLMGNSTISMAIFNSYVCLPEGMAYEYEHIN